MNKAYLSTPPEFSFEQCYRFLARSPKECLHYTQDGRISKCLEIGDALHLVLIEEGKGKRLNLHFPLGKPAADLSRCKQYLADWLDLDRDLKPFYTLGKKDAVLQTLVKKFYGLRLIGIPDLFEALSWAIIGQQINLNFAYSLKQRLVENYGASIEYQETTYFLFPKPQHIASLTPADLRPLQFSQRKAEYLIDLAQLMDKGALDKAGLNQLDFESAKKRLLAIRGIGNWTANYVIMKCLRHPDAFPIEDAGLHNALKAQLKMARKPTLDEISQLAESWAGWRAYATFYLWQSLLKSA